MVQFAVYVVLQHPLAAADDCDESRGILVVSLAGERFDESVYEIGRNFRPQTTARLISSLCAGLK